MFLDVPRIPTVGPSWSYRGPLKHNQTWLAGKSPIRDHDLPLFTVPIWLGDVPATATFDSRLLFSWQPYHKLQDETTQSFCTSQATCERQLANWQPVCQNHRPEIHEFPCSDPLIKRPWNDDLSGVDQTIHDDKCFNSHIHLAKLDTGANQYIYIYTYIYIYCIYIYINVENHHFNRQFIHVHGPCSTFLLVYPINTEPSRALWGCFRPPHCRSQTRGYPPCMAGPRGLPRASPQIGGFWGRFSFNSHHNPIRILS